MKKFRPIQVRWNEPLGREDCPYMRRYVLNLGIFAIRLHIWYRSDDKRYMHDHPWGFLTFVLSGEYTDVSRSQDGKIKRDRVSRFCFRRRTSAHRHYVEIPPAGCVSLLFTSAQNGKWGFYVPNREARMRPLRFFSRYGHPPCDEQ